jgi:ATP-binding cassette subfamily B protein
MDLPLRGYAELLSKYMKPQWPRAVLLAVLLLGSIGLQLLNPQIVRFFIDSAMANAGLDTLVMAALLFIAVALANQGLTVAATYVSGVVGWTATNALRTDLAAHCLGLDMTFHKTHTPGELIERIDGDVTALSNFFSRFVVQVFGNMLLMLGVVVVLFFEDWRVGLALFVFALLAMFVLARSRNIAVSALAAERQGFADLFGFIEERLSGLPDIKANGAQSYVMLRLYQVMRALYRKGRKAWAMDVLVWVITMLIFALGYVVAFGMGAYLYSTAAITIGTVFLFFNYIEILRRPLEEITEQMQELQKASAGIGRVQALYRIENKIIEGEGNQAIPAGPLAVEFQGVTFGYDQEETVLKDFSFHLQPGKVLGLLGPTGSGKTTLTRLLFRLYDPGAGAIRLGDGDIREARKADLRQRVGMVTQDVQLFHATVRDNLTLFDKSIPDDRILEVIREVGLYKWYESLSDGLDTELGPGGAGLSAGEAQLLAFTRVFLKDPGLVILDEASSRLDPATERRIEYAVEKLLRNRTGIIIAHRLATVQRADEVMILEDGRIREHGPRERLAGNPGSHFSHLLRTGMEEVLV